VSTNDSDHARTAQHNMAACSSYNPLTMLHASSYNKTIPRFPLIHPNASGKFLSPASPPTRQTHRSNRQALLQPKPSSTLLRPPHPT